MGYRIIVTLVLATVPMLTAADNSITQLYDNIINNVGSIPKPEDLVPEVNENTLRALSAEDIQDLLPIGMRCVESNNDTIRRDGMLLMLGVTVRSDSTALMEPYIGKLEAIASNPTDALKEGALYVLANTKPNMAAKTRAFLTARLTDKSNSAGQRLMIASSLLRNNADQKTTEDIVKFAETESDTSVKAGILTQFGRLNTTNVDALAFIGTSLNSGNLYVRRAAVEATGKLDYAVRVQFSDKLAAIAANPKENSGLRSQASAVLARAQ